MSLGTFLHHGVSTSRGYREVLFCLVFAFSFLSFFPVPFRHGTVFLDKSLIQMSHTEVTHSSLLLQYAELLLLVAPNDVAPEIFKIWVH